MPGHQPRINVRGPLAPMADPIPGLYPDIPARDDQTLVDDAMALLVDLWPTRGGATVISDGPTWDRLRRVLLAVPNLWSGDDRA